MSFNNLTVSEIIDQAFHFYSHDSNYAVPGFYDIDILDATWVLSATLIYFTMHTGIAFLEFGTVNPKNQVNVMMKHFVDICAGGVCFWMFGFGLMFGRGEYTHPFFGFGDFFVNASADDPLAGQLFTLFFNQISFATTATTLVSGAVAERFKFTSYILFSFLMTIVYGVGAGWLWGQHGWLKNIGAIDFAGSGPIHLIAGAAAFSAAWYIGPRIGRYDKGTDPLPLSSPLNVCVGLFILWWGWIGFNAGSSYGITNGKWASAARAGAGTTLASMAGGLTSIFYSLARHKGKVDVLEVVMGILCALVAINSGCYVFSMNSAFFTGCVAAILCLLVAPIIDKMGVDDAVGATAVHAVGGIWGQISVGIFADPPTGTGLKGLLFGGGPYQLIVQMISAASLFIWASISTLVVMWIVDITMKVRLDPEDEKLGCDLTQHHIAEVCGNQLQRSQTTMDKIINITTPIAQRFTGQSDERHGHREMDNFGRRKPFSREGHANPAYDTNDRV